MAEYRRYYRRNLPHFQPQGAALFVTCRLAGSLPAQVVDRLHEELDFVRAEMARQADGKERADQLYREYRRAFGRFDTLLDTAKWGPRWLADPAIADLVFEEARRQDDCGLSLIISCIMPNHVHLVFTPQIGRGGEPVALAALMHAFKGRTARAANERLERRGEFWQHESYDHAVRDQDELARIVAYVKNNPVKAGLVTSWEKWPWTYARG